MTREQPRPYVKKNIWDLGDLNACIVPLSCFIHLYFARSISDTLLLLVFE